MPKLVNLQRPSRAWACQLTLPQTIFLFFASHRFVYEYYVETLRARNAVDFNDMINLVHQLVKEYTEVCERMHRQFRHVLVDEVQDLSKPQYEMLCAIAPKFTVVGDDDQVFLYSSAARLNGVVWGAWG